MNVAADQVRETFLAALRLLPERRDAYLHEACPGAENLRERIKRLIQAHEELGSIVDAAATPTSLPAEPPTVSEQAGLVLAGRYELLRKAGEGGMGTVWMARQTEPVKRLVAVKLVKAGMDSKGVLARFEAERQALALMDHPNIAKVLDAGTTPEGRPFFVMELVEGVPITRFCDERRLTPRQRLELFVPVCAAVQHAHQKGILHRDLKPSNLLVAQYDHGAVPKVIDFGLAKAIGQQFAEQTLQTGLGAVVGTLEYMSPEQASFNQLDVDTRSDVYALGVLLYELLAGAPPFSWKEVEGAGVLEMLRLIREQEPTRPSARLSMSEGLPALAASRGTEPGKLTRLVRGELDWIALKALEKDRNRRYESASAFAADVLRYLSDQPVQACPPSAWYRFRKFARRNKRALGTAALLGFMLLVACGAVAGTVGWTLRDRDARRAATAARFDQIVQESERLYREGKLPEANATAKKAQELVEAGSEGEESRRRLRGWLADLEMVARLEAIRGKWQDVWNPGAWQYADAFRAYGIDLDVLPPAETAARIADRPVKVDLAVALDAWACYDPARNGCEPSRRPPTRTRFGPASAPPRRRRNWRRWRTWPRRSTWARSPSRFSTCWASGFGMPATRGRRSRFSVGFRAGTRGTTASAWLWATRYSAPNSHTTGPSTRPSGIMPPPSRSGRTAAWPITSWAAHCSSRGGGMRASRCTADWSPSTPSTPPPTSNSPFSWRRKASWMKPSPYFAPPRPRSPRRRQPVNSWPGC